MTNSVLGVRNIQHTNGTSSYSIAADGTITTDKFIIPPAGGIIQIQYAQSTTRTSQAFSAQTYNKLTSFPSATITPTSTSSKIMIDIMWNGEFSPVGNTWNSAFCLYRGNTLIVGNTEDNTGWSAAVAQGMFTPTTSYTSSDADSTPEQGIGKYFDTPSTTSAITYYLGYYTGNASGTIYINGMVNASTSGGYERYISNMTLTEIAG